jgi:hypothetical protein
LGSDRRTPAEGRAVHFASRIAPSFPEAVQERAFGKVGLKKMKKKSAKKKQ